MNVVETIREKVFHLPPKAQEEVLRQVEQIEERYHISEEPEKTRGTAEHPLTTIARLKIDGLPSDFASRHDFYCHGKLEDVGC